jgi:glutathione S-transferase
MKLYDAPMSPNSRVPRLIASEVGIPLDLALVEFSKGDHKKASFLAINPNGKVPVLQDGNFILWESSAIAVYLASQKPSAGLAPATPKERADMDRWILWTAYHLAPALVKIVFQRVIKKMFNMGPPDEPTVAQGFAEFERFAGVLDTHLSHHPYLANDQLSVADFVAAVNFIYRKEAQLDISKWKHIQAWLERIESRPSWAATAPKT